MMSNIYVLHAAFGYHEDQESIIIGAFSTQEEAEIHKRKISETTRNYRVKITENDNIIKDRLSAWLDKMPSVMSLKEKETTMSDYIKIVQHVKKFGGVDFTNSDSARKDFFKTFDMYKLPLQWFDNNPLPDFPPIVTWSESYPCVYDYQMKIDEIQVGSYIVKNII